MVAALAAVIAAEVLGDFLALARAALAEHNKDVAAVLACAALEDALKRFARENDWVVFTHDLDFGAILAHTRTAKPSVV